MTRILVAEDDRNIRMGLTDTLESEGYSVRAAVDGNEAMDFYEKERFDLVILDIMMPGKSGYDVCRAVRKKDERIPIIMLTAKGEEIDKVIGLELGADDYITKPFGVHELLARIAAVLRRANLRPPDENGKGDSNGMPEPFVIGGAEVDTKRFRLVKGSEVLPLSAKEIKLLHYFSEHPDEVLGRDRLLNAVWGVDYFGTTRTLDQHISQLRKKIEKDPKNPEVIATVHGVGYRYRKDNG